MKVNEIFTSIEGEGIRAGYPCTFIRLFGCNLKCSYCDTQYACVEGSNVRDWQLMSVYDIVTKVQSLGVRRVTITGGEPLIHEDILLLKDVLADQGFEVNFETNGSIPLKNFVTDSRVIITMDFKTPSSGMMEQMFVPNIRNLREQDVLKFVVGSKKDLNIMKECLRTYPTKAQVFVSPVFGRIEPKEIVEFLLANELYDCRVQLQLHKIIWDPQKRGV